MTTIPDVSADDYTAAEQQIADGINSAFNRRERNDAGVALAIGSAFLLYRMWMSRRLREQTQGSSLPTADALEKLSQQLLGLYLNKWIATALPAVIAGVTLGAQEGGAAATEQMRLHVATDYARALGPMIHDVSTKSMVEGYQGMLNRRVIGRTALDRVIDSFGVLPRTMRSLVNMWTAPTATDRQGNTLRRPDGVKARIDRMIAGAIAERAQTLGDTESQSIKNSAKVILWTAAYVNGDLPTGVLKRWRTAADERVCPVCAPMDGTTVEIDALFELPNGQRLYAPSPHPRCRCAVELDYSQVGQNFAQYAERSDYALAKRASQSVWGVVHKAQGADKYDRDEHGRFATNESRGGARAKNKRLKITGRPEQVDYSDPRAQEIVEATDRLVQPQYDRLVAHKLVSLQQPEQLNQTQSLRSEQLTSDRLRVQRFTRDLLQHQESQLQAAREEIAQSDLTPQEEEQLLITFTTADSSHETTHPADYEMAYSSKARKEANAILNEIDERADDWFAENASWKYAEDKEDEEIYGGLKDYDESRDEHGDDLASGGFFVQVRLGTVDVLINRDMAHELMNNLYHGYDDIVELPYVLAGTGYIPSSSSANAMREYRTSGIIAAMPDSDRLVYDVIRSRLVGVVHTKNEQDADGYLNRDQIEGLDDHYEEMVSDPFNEDLTNRIMNVYPYPQPPWSESRRP